MASHEGGFREEEGTLRGEQMSSIKEYMGRKKAKPEWTPSHPETRVPKSSTGSFEGLIQLNKCWIFPMFASSFRITSQDQNYELYALEHFMTPGTHHRIFYQTGSFYLPYHESVYTFQQIFDRRWTLILNICSLNGDRINVIALEKPKDLK